MVLKYSITPSTYFGFLTSLMILKFLCWQKQRTAEFELKTQAFVSSVLIMRAKMVEMGLQREKVERMERCKTARSVLLNDASSCGISKVWEFLLHAHYIKSISYKKWHKNRRRQKVALSNILLQGRRECCNWIYTASAENLKFTSQVRKI